MIKYRWLFPFIGGFLALIGVLTPIASLYNYFNIWMWGLVFPRILSDEFEFINDRAIFITGLSTSIIILIFSLILIITAYIFRQGFFNNRRIERFWIAFGLIIFAATIVSIVSLDFYTYDGYFPHGIWQYLNPGFGATGPIIGSILAVGIGVYISLSEGSKINSRQKIIPYSEFAPKINCPFCGKEISLNATFCSNCGKTIED